MCRRATRDLDSHHVCAHRRWRRRWPHNRSQSARAPPLPCSDDAGRTLPHPCRCGQAGGLHIALRQRREQPSKRCIWAGASLPATFSAHLTPSRRGCRCRSCGRRRRGSRRSRPGGIGVGSGGGASATVVASGAVLVCGVAFVSGWRATASFAGASTMWHSALTSHVPRAEPRQRRHSTPQVPRLTCDGGFSVSLRLTRRPKCPD